MAEPLCLEGRLDLGAAAALHAALLARRGGDLQIDMSAVSFVGALGLQALLAASRSLRARGHGLQLCHVPAPVLQQMQAMGLPPRSCWRAADEPADSRRR